MSELSQGVDSEVATVDRYLIFAIGKESFAAPLLSIREIVEAMAYRSVPNPHSDVLGLANLRGQVVGVMDLGRSFGLEAVEEATNASALIFEVDGTVLAGLVHRVEAVMAIPKETIDIESRIDMTIPSPAFRGIANVASRLIPVVNLTGLLDARSTLNHLKEAS